MPPARLQSLNVPQPVAVATDRDGAPRTITLRRRRHQVRAIRDRWWVEEGWWRATPSRRFYFRIELDAGREVIVYRDLVTGGWWTQRR